MDAAANEQALFDWFDGTTACPECHHTCFDHASCREDDACPCHNECHFGVLSGDYFGGAS